VSHDDNRDASLERILRRTAALPPSRTEPDALRRAGPDPRTPGHPEPRAGGECLDAEMLAAWSEGSLRGAERAAAERHAADCAHCQAMLAAMVRTEPVPSVRPAWWRTSMLRWAVPLTAVAAVMVWVLAPPAERVRQPAAPVETPGSPAADAAARGDVPASSKTAETPTRERPAGRTGAPGAKTHATQDQLTVRESPSRGRLGREEAPNAAPSAATARRSEAPAAAPPAMAPSTSAVETARLQAKQLSSIPLEIASPDPSIRWRIGAGGLVQRSTDGGAAWQTQTTGVATDLLAASAPSPTICWAVGRAGTVIVTTDGRTWRRLTFPDRSDLVGVAATSATAADVTTADGRRFRTVNGATWIEN
jgi:hypothetical protein